MNNWPTGDMNNILDCPFSRLHQDVVSTGNRPRTTLLLADLFKKKNNQVLKIFEIAISRQIFTVWLITKGNFIFNLFVRKEISKINIL